MKKKLTRASIEELCREIPVLNREEQRMVSGGDGSSDCFFGSIAFITGRSVESVTADYVNYYAETYNVSIAGAGFVVYRDGVKGADMKWVTQHYGLTPGYASCGDYEHSTEGDGGIIVLNNKDEKGNSCGHAMVITGEASATEYYYYDPQKETTGRISKTDPRIVGVYKQCGNTDTSDNIGSCGNTGSPDCGNVGGCGNFVS